MDIDSLDNTEVAPLLVNARDDSPDLVSTAAPMSVQQNASFIIDLDALPNRKDLFSDDNGSWKMTGARLKFFTVNKDGSKVVRIEKVGTEQDAHIAIRRRSYICTSFKQTIVAIEYGREIEKWFPVAPKLPLRGRTTEISSTNRMETERSRLLFHTSVLSKVQKLSWWVTCAILKQVLNVRYLTLSEMLVAL